jgi:FMN phosphatase YigB (HAD superfamily)/ribulose-5-phosphate 4-epimerase/fuculose-1-phosphate aldolase
MFYKAIIFDLDNTIYDYQYCHNIALKNVFNFINEKTNIDISFLNQTYTTISNNVKYDLKNTASSHNKTIYFKKLLEILNMNLLFLNQINLTYWSSFYENINFFPYFQEFLNWNKNKGIKIAILTDYQTEHQIIKLEKLKLTEYIDLIITSEEIGIEKPSNYGFLSILNKMKLNINDVIMIGDNYEKYIIGSNNLNIKNYQFYKNNNFYKNLLEDFENIYNELISLKNISLYCGERFDLVQAGGGNTSVKLNTNLNDNLMIIKSSGVNLSVINEKTGYTIINNKLLLENLLENKIAKNIIDYNFFGNNRGSIETYMHSFLKKYTVHLHPIQINKILISKNAKNIIHQLFNNPLIIDYITPGINLAKIIKNKYNNENIIFLINHGIIFTTNNYDEIFDLIETTINKFEQYLNINFSIYKNTNIISKTINNLYNTTSITYLSQNYILKKYLLNLSNFNYNISFPDCLIYCGLKVCFNINELNKNYKPNIIIYNDEVYINSSSLNKCKEIEEVLVANLLILDTKLEKNYLSDNEINYLNNWEAEIYRKNI